MKQSSTLAIVFFTIFIDMLGVGILIPVFPLLVTHGSEFCIMPDGWSQGDSYIMSGWLLAAYPLVQFLFTPILGQLSDCIGRRKLLIISIFGTALSYVLFGISILLGSVVGLFISRILDGISGGNISTAQAVIADISKPEHRARNFGLIGVSIGAGFVLGPAIGGILSSPSVYHAFNAATPFWFSAALSLINCIWVYNKLPETCDKHKILDSIDFKCSIRNIRKMLSLGQLSKIIPVVFIFNFGWTFFTSFWGIVLASKYLFNQAQIGGYFAFLGIMIIFAQGGVVRRISGRIDEIKVLKFAFLLSAFCLLGYYLAPANSVRYIFMITPFLAIGTALVKAFSSALITRVSDKDKFGEAMGINSSANALAQAIPAIFAGYVAYFDAPLAVLVGAVFAFIAWLIFILLWHKV